MRAPLNAPQQWHPRGPSGCHCWRQFRKRSRSPTDAFLGPSWSRLRLTCPLRSQTDVALAR
eukprot:3615629-Pyramimonas_sp.AAC.1